MHSSSRVVVVALVSVLLVLANAIVASADVVSNVRVTIGPFTQPNVCEPTEGPLVFTVTEHRLTRVESDGTVVFHVNAHGTAVTTDGTRYEINRTLVSTTTAGVITTEVFIRRISHGSGENAVITIVNGVVTDQRCLG